MNDLTNYPLWTAIITPFKPDLSIDWESFEGLLREQEKAHVAVVLLGSTGEGLALSLPEKEKVITFAKSLNLKIPLMVGVGGFQLEDQKRWIDYCTSEGIDAFLLVTPIYAKPGPLGQEQWFKELLMATTRPCMLYNVPSRAGVKLHFDTVEKLARAHKNFWAIKEASGSVAEFKEYAKRAPDVALYSGDDGLCPDFAPFGLKGLVSVASNIWPVATLEYIKACIAGEKNLQDTWEESCDALFTASNPIPAKALLYQLKRIQCPQLRPPLALEDLKSIEPLIKANEAISSWFTQRSSR